MNNTQDQSLYSYMAAWEGIKNKFYDDGRGVISIGVGYTPIVLGKNGIWALRNDYKEHLKEAGINLSKEDEQVFQQLEQTMNLPNSNPKRAEYIKSAIKSLESKYTLPQKGAHKLFDYVKGDYQQILEKNIDKDLLKNLDPQRKAALFSMAYQSPASLHRNAARLNQSIRQNDWKATADVFRDVGQRLHDPKRYNSKADIMLTPDDPNRETIVRGYYISNIAEKRKPEGMSTTEFSKILMKYNSIADGEKQRPGQSIHIPDLNIIKQMQAGTFGVNKQEIKGSSADDILSSHSPEDLAKAQRLSDQMQTAQTVSLNGVEVPLNMPDLYHQDDVRALQAELLQNRNHPQKAAMQDSITAWYKQALPGNIQKDETGRMIPVQTPSRPQNMANLLKDIPAFNQNSQTAADHVKDLTKRANLAKKAKSVPLPGGVSLNKAEKTTTAAQSNVSFENQKEQIINKDKLNTYKMLDQQREATIKKANTPPALETPQLTQSAGANTSTAPQRTPEEQAIFKQEAIKKGSEIGEQLGDAAFNISNGKVLGGLADASRNISEFMPDIKGVNVGNLAADGLDAAQKFKDGDKLGGALSIASGALNAYQSYNSDSPAFKEGLTDKARVICTELHAQGRLDTELYKLDVSFTKRCLSATTIRGYHLWAVPFVKVMRKYPLLSYVVCPVARWRAEEIAYIMGARPKGNYKGMIVRLFGEPICFLLGLFKRETDWKVLY